MSLRTPPRPSLLSKGPEPNRALRNGAIALALVLVLGGGVTLVALTGGDEKEEPVVPAPSSTVAPAPPPSVQDPLEPTRAAVVTSWRGYWTAVQESSSRADPDWPALSEYMTGRALTEAQLYLTGLQRNGLTERGTLELRNPRVVALDATTATIWDCVFDDGHQYDRNGQRVDKSGAVTRGAEAKLLLVAGKWKVSERPVPKPEACA